MFIRKYGEKLYFECDLCGTIYSFKDGESFLPIEANICQGCLKSTTPEQERMQ